MTLKDFFEYSGMVGAFILPLFNIPLIVKVIKRKSSEDISIVWALGVYTCFIIMAPSGFSSTDIVWRIFNIVNFIFFSGVVFVTLKYRKGNHL